MADRPLPAFDGDEAYIFVTYAHQDAEFVYPHIRWLQNQGINVWWDEGISPGAAWRSELAQAIRGCSLLVYFVTPNSVLSEHCTREVHFALDEHHRPILAVHLSETTLPDALALSLSDRQAILEHALEPADYERKLISAVSTHLNQALPDISLPVPRRRIPRQSAWPLVAIGTVSGAVVAALAIWQLIPSDPQNHGRLARFVVDVPPGVSIPKAGTMPLSISGDGTKIAFSGTSQDRSPAIFLRPLEELDASHIAGSEGEATSVSLSPDGESVAYFGIDGKLKRISTDGGRASLIAQDVTRGMSWADDGTIVFSTQAGDLMLISESGSILIPAPDGEKYTSPYLLRDGSAVLFVESKGDNRSDLFDARIVALSLETGEKRELLEGLAPRVTSRGHLLFARDDSIWAVNFDRSRLRVTGAPAPVLNDVEFTLAPGPIYSVADNGAMVYLPKEPAVYRLKWLSRDGLEVDEITMPMPPVVYAQPQISLDGRSVLIRVQVSEKSQLWRYSVERGTLTKLHDNAITFLWSADSSTIYYSSAEGGQVTLMRRKADGTGAEETLINNERHQFPTSRSSDGEVIFYHECDDFIVACDIGRLTLSNEPVRELLLNADASERAPALSPDGRWLAYESDRSGRYEIYVRPYPDLTEGRWQVSKDGGRHPQWSPDTGTLYYESGISERRQMMAVTLSSDDEFIASIPEQLFEFRSAFLTGIVRNFDLHPDGDRFLLATPGEQQAERLIYVENWLDEVERLVPTVP